MLGNVYFVMMKENGKTDDKAYASKKEKYSQEEKRMKTLKKVGALLFALIFAMALLAGCGGGGNTPAPAGSGSGAAAPGGGDAVIKIGYVSPITGPMSHFSVGMDRTIQNVVAKMNETGYDIGGTHYTIEVIKGDSESDPVKAAEVATKLVQSDGCQILLGEWTPDTMNPVSEAAEKLKVPCIVDGGPDISWTAAGPYDYSFACAMRYEKQVDEYFNAMDQMDTNKKIGLVLDSSMDGIGMLDLVKAAAEKYGYEIVNPDASELAQEGSTDFTAIVQKIQAADADIMLASLLGFQLSGLWANVDSLGYRPKFVILSKGMHFSSDVLTLTNAAGECTGAYTCIETQWNRQYPFTSSLLGKTAEELSADFEENVNEAPDLTIGWDYVFFDLIDEALKTTASTSSEDIVAALENIQNFDCIYGTLSCDEEHVFETPITFGQWVPDEKWGLRKAVTGAKHVPAAEPILEKQVDMQWK